jgi:hypothetical protein
MIRMPDGRTIKVAAGRGISQTVNICTVEGKDGNYEYIVRLPPESITGGFLQQNFTTHLEVFDHVSQLPGAVVERPTAGRLPPGPDPLNKPETLARQIIRNIENHRVLSVLIAIGIALVGIGAVTGAIEAVLSFVEKRFIARR